jgi:hypothetical protein
MSSTESQSHVGKSPKSHTPLGVGPMELPGRNKINNAARGPP